MADFEYFRAEESDQFSFFRIPKALFSEKEFASLSTDAKLLYGILLDRISLSKKNGWIDGDGYVYIIYTIAELQELLRMSHTTVTKLLYELDSVHGIGSVSYTHLISSAGVWMTPSNWGRKIWPSRTAPRVHPPMRTADT